MTLDELKHIFRFQTTKSEDFEPIAQVEYQLINGQNKVIGKHDADKMDTLLAQLLEGQYILDAYRDRMPVFIKPEAIVVL
jgi:hypothetical protein